MRFAGFGIGGGILASEDGGGCKYCGVEWQMAQCATDVRLTACLGVGEILSTEFAKC